jgi:Subtilase family
MRGATRSSLWVVAAFGAVLGAGAAPAAADPPTGANPILAQLVQEVGGRGAAQAPQHYAYLQKLDSHLQDVAANRLGTGSAASAADAAERQGLTTSPDGAVAVDVYVDADGSTGAVADALRALGMRVTSVSDSPPQRMVEGFLPAAALAQAAAIPSARAVLAPFSTLSAGSVQSQGDAAIHGPQARAFGPTGAGVSVGIISDSINQSHGGVAASQATGDLPASVVALSDEPGGTDEGRAMAEIAYDEAPGIAGIVFASADGGPSAKAASIDSLVAHGVKVIADDTSYVTEPFFQDDVVAQAVDRARAAGVAYFVAAGNDAQQSWEGTFSGTSFEDFDPGPAVDTIQTIGTLNAAHQTATIVLQWAEPWGRASTDLAIDVYRINGSTATQVGQEVNTNNLVTGIPEEVATVNSGTNNSYTYGIAIRRVAGAASPFMKFIDFTNGAGTVAMDHPTNSSAISPEAASADGALTVAASRYSTPTTPEAFSSRGPVTRYFDSAGNPLPVPDVRQKPDLAAPDGVNTTVSGFAPFYGTSAATPAAAGIAALILSAKPAMSIDELSAIMTNPVNALDCTLTAGAPDRDCGAGFVLADRALGMALDGTPPVVTPVVSPAAPDGADGWYSGPVNVTWNVGDGESPVVSITPGCAATSPGDGATTLTCSATSAGGTTTVPVTIKRDSTPPTAPVIAGLAHKTYDTTSVPQKPNLRCSASDPTSGVDGCTVSGFKTSAGRHTLTAVAVNDAGLTTTAELVYTVVKPDAISHLKLARGLTLTKLAQSGAPLTVRVAAPATRLAITLAARIGTRTIVLAHTTKRAARGTIGLSITLTTRARRQLAAVAKTTLTLTVTGSAKSARRTSLHGSRVSGQG